MATKFFFLLILGVMLLIAGYIMQNVEAGLGLWAGVGYALAALSLGFYVFRNRSDLGQMLTRRSARYGVVSLAFVLVFIGILVLVSLFSEKHNHRWDLTSNKTHSIALQSRQVMQRLDRDTLNLTAYVFYRGEADLMSKQALTDLLDTYAGSSRHFKYEKVDIDRNPLLALQLGITSTSTLLLQYGERQEKIYSDQESKITNAIATLLKGSAPGRRGAVYFVTGHGEPAMDPTESYGYGQAKEAIEGQIGPVRELLLATGKPVPDSCEILVVAGPQKSFLPAELEAVTAYLRRGGKALFLLEPFMSTGLIPYLGQYGIKAGDDIVIDMLRGAVGSPFAFLVSGYPQFDITRDFNVGTVFDMACSVRADSVPPPGVTATNFILTSEKSFAESDRQLLQTRFDLVAQKALDNGAPVPIAVAAALKPEFFRERMPSPADTSASVDSTAAGAAETRIVVIGDRDFISNAYLGQLGNKDLLLNCMRWLLGESEEITIAPRETAETPMVLQRSQLLTMGLVILVALPALIIFTGVFIWVRRRSKR
jgi:ABC-type uncharacterized transport system involved in gliding motility auxiliary subunit